MKQNIIISIILTSILLSFLSCDEKLNPIDPLFEINPTTQDGNFVFQHEDGEYKLLINSNIEWFLDLEFLEDISSEEEWCSLYPKKGTDEGRVYLTIKELSSPYKRTCKLLAYDKSGNELASVTITQNGTAPYIEIDESPLSSSSLGGSFTVNVISNINWIANLLPANEQDDLSWISLSTSTKTSQTIVLTENQENVKRNATLRFTKDDDEEIYVDKLIVQLPLLTVDNAALISISDLLSDFNNVIEDNIKIEGFVVSNKSTGNTPANELIIQDNSGKGILILFDKAADNIYTMNQKLAVWATGGTLRETNGIKTLTNLSASNFFDNTPSLSGNEAPYVELTDINLINDYPYTLVKLKDVSFAIPIGTVFNGNSEDANKGKTYLNVIRDKQGNTAMMRTEKAFTEKFHGNKTASNYNITALVLPDKGEIITDKDGKTNRLVHEVVPNMLHYSHVLKIRKFEDLELSTNSHPYNTLASWFDTSNPAPSTIAPSYWVQKEGSGAVFDILNTGTSPDGRNAYTLIDPSQPLANNTYWGIAKQDLNESHWQFSIPTNTVSGNIHLSLMAGTFGTSARFWQVQWSKDGVSWNDLEGGQYELRNSYSTTNNDLERVYIPQELAFKFPIAASEGETLHIRLKVTANIRVYAVGPTTTISNVSPSILMFVGVYEQK